MSTKVRNCGGKKSGAYVWKKYEYTPEHIVTVENPQFTYDDIRTTNSDNDTITITTSDFDCYAIKDSWKEFLNGFGLTYEHGSITLTLENDSLIYRRYNTSGVLHHTMEWTSFTPLSSTQATIIGTSNFSSFSGPFVFAGTKQYTAPSVIGNIIDYVVSDSPTAYPDGGEQGGYWYEKVTSESEIVDFLKTFGFTKVAIDKITYASETSAGGLSIKHSLGSTPRFAYILANPNEVTASSVDEIVNMCYGLTSNRASSSKAITSTAYGIRAFGSDSLAIYNYSSIGYFAKGVEYTVITACY